MTDVLPHLSMNIEIQAAPARLLGIHLTFRGRWQAGSIGRSAGRCYNLGGIAAILWEPLVTGRNRTAP
jgi:hypothetical protein